MNDLNQDPTQNQTTVGYCQNCGKPLDSASARIVGSAVFCEPCLAARLNTTSTEPRFTANPAPDASTPGGYSTVNAGAQPAWTGAAPGASMPTTSTPNPGLAAWLGFIPGVGAMYNEQYAKGIVHLIIFTILVSLTNASDVFLIFVFGWEAYMAIEAHHTAKARRDGLPLPNPFGLNDIGERMGFGKAWPTGSTVAGTVRDAAEAARAGFNSTASQPGPVTTPPYYAQQPVQQPVPQAAPWGAPESVAPGVNPGGYTPYPPDYHAIGTNAWQAAHGIPVNAYMPPMAGYPTTEPYVPPANRFPAGAVWLIGLGAFFLLATTGVFHLFRGNALIGFVLIGLGVWSFLKRMTDSGSSLRSDGSPLYAYRIFRALRLSIWLVLAGAWFLLDAFHLITFHRSWPLFVILAGVMTLLERAAGNAAANASFAATPPFAPAASTGPAPIQTSADSTPVEAQQIGGQ